ncbi:MAG: endonuclease/exonuclease/phosphatase family protein [Verrucomicrobia bacterium]|nr:endonuclease/exonuclease/phosphatase family protein [Verrucomicrobiota bacterium]
MTAKHVILSCLAALAVSEAAAAEPPLKVMSFNIRYGTAKDGTNEWRQRRDLVVQTIQDFGPDLLGLQEVLNFQADYLQAQLPGYAFHGVGREDGAAKGEFVPLMYRRDRFALEDSGHFWLSETPDVPGSISWDSSLTRMVSWVRLRDPQGGAGSFIFANAHFDHRGAQARTESARLIRRRAEAVAPEFPVVLCGDFNTTEDGKPYAILVRGEEMSGQKAVDCHRAASPERSPDEATYHGWTGRRAGSRIDWIITSPQFDVLKAAINHASDRGRYPSDHFPVQAVLRLNTTR